MSATTTKFTFKENERKNLAECFKRANSIKVNEFINRAENHINDLLWVIEQGSGYTASESKEHLGRINKTAAALLHELNKPPTKHVFKAILNVYYPEKRKLEKIIDAVTTLEKESQYVKNKIKPITNNKPTGKELTSMLENSYFSVFKKPYGQGKGTPFYIFKLQVFEIFNSQKK